MKLDDLPSSPTAPELVVTEARDVQGLDLLGLRSPAEAIAVRLMDGITTITPAVRYFALRAWIISRYLALGGLNEWQGFRRYAAKVEAAIAFGNVLAHGGAPGVIGRNKAASIIQHENGDPSLRPLTKILAVSVYAGSAESLGLGDTLGEVPTLTKERGIPLAEAFGAIAQDDPVLKAVTADDVEQRFSRKDLSELGRRLPMTQPAGTERRLLIDAIIPRKPRERELPRVAAYCLLLHLCRELKRNITEADVFAASAAEALDPIPPELHVGCDGWTRFIVRDLLVFVHEAAVALAVQRLGEANTPERRLPLRAVIASLVAEHLEDSLSGVGIRGLSADRPIRELCDAVMQMVGTSRQVCGLHRWAGPFNELSITDHAGLLVTPAGLALLPVAWILACHRLGPGIESQIPGFDLEGGNAASRLGVGAVLLPEVRSWQNSSLTIREVVARLVHRSVDQHLRIAWSRMAREPHKDVSLLQSDGDDWIYLKDMRPGQATSRLYQAINWLRQLRLSDENGVTAEGEALLEAGLALLKQLKGGGE